jgi:hypothetical protein
MIGKAGHRFSLGTNAKRLPGDHAEEMERDGNSTKIHRALNVAFQVKSFKHKGGSAYDCASSSID